MTVLTIAQLELLPVGEHKVSLLNKEGYLEIVATTHTTNNGRDYYFNRGDNYLIFEIKEGVLSAYKRVCDIRLKVEILEGDLELVD